MERKLIAAAVSSALALPMAAQAVEFSVSGHINRAIISVDGGDNDGDLQHVDANSSETRFRFTGSEELDSGVTAGVQLELGGPSDWRTRHANVYLTTAGGRITIGQASAATDGMAHARLGGPSWLGGATNWCSYASSGPACPSNDGGRIEVLRYDTPAIGPASLALSAGNDDYWDAQLKIAGSFGDAGYDLRIGHIAKHDNQVAAVPGSLKNLTLEGLLDAFEGLEIQARDKEDGSLKVDDEGKRVMTKVTKGTFKYNEDGILEDNSRKDFQNALNAYRAKYRGDWINTVNSDDDPDTERSKDANIAGPDGVLWTKDDGYSLGTAERPATTEDAGDITTASAAVSFGQGTSVAVAWSQDNLKDHEYQYVELDHSYGDGSVGVYYKRGESKGVEKTKGSLWGLAVGHSLGGGATAYAGYRQISEDGKEDVDLIVAGMRVTFN